jgi:Phage integrase family.
MIDSPSSVEPITIDGKITKNRLKQISDRPWAGQPKTRWVKNVYVHVSPTGKITFRFRYYETNNKGETKRKSCKFHTFNKRETDLNKLLEQIIPQLESNVSNGLPPLSKQTPGKKCDLLNSRIAKWGPFYGKSLGNPKTFNENISAYERHIAQYLGNKPSHSLTLGDWYQTLRGYKSPHSRAKLMGAMKKYYDWELHQADTKVTAHPLATLKKTSFDDYSAKKKEQRWFTATELPYVIWAIDQIKHPSKKNALLLALYTGARITELQQLNTCDIIKSPNGNVFWDLEEHKIQKSSTINEERSITRPLPQPLINLFKEASPIQGEYFFPSTKGSSKHPWRDEKLFSEAIKDLVSILKNHNKEFKHFSPEAFRNTVATYIDEQFDSQTENLVLGHFTADRYGYSEAKGLDIIKNAYGWWGNKLDELRDTDPFLGQTSDNNLKNSGGSSASEFAMARLNKRKKTVNQSRSTPLTPLKPTNSQK